MSNEEGATKAPPQPKDPADFCLIEGETPDMDAVKGRKHCFRWIWENEHWTDRVRCSSCGQERIRLRDSDHVVV